MSAKGSILQGRLVYGRFDYRAERGSPGGFRFVEVRVPKGAEIRRAYIQFSAEDFDGEVTELWIRAELAGDALG